MSGATEMGLKRPPPPVEICTSIASARTAKENAAGEVTPAAPPPALFAGRLVCAAKFACRLSNVSYFFLREYTAQLWIVDCASGEGDARNCRSGSRVRDVEDYHHAGSVGDSAVHLDYLAARRLGNLLDGLEAISRRIVHYGVECLWCVLCCETEMHGNFLTLDFDQLRHLSPELNLLSGWKGNLILPRPATPATSCPGRRDPVRDKYLTPSATSPNWQIFVFAHSLRI